THIEQNVHKPTDRMTEFDEHLMKIGWRLSYITQGLQNFRRIILAVLLDANQSNEKVYSMYDEIDRWIDPIVNQLINESAKNWENT
ncbi:hypothetical protein R0J91_18695, partial [Micrococcus sp. SIMBA_131]